MPAEKQNTENRILNTQRWVTRRLLVVGGLAAAVVFLLGVSPRPTDLRVANVTARSLAVGWATQGESRGCVWAVADKTPWRIVQSCSLERAAAHLVTLAGLEPETSYRLVYVTGLKVQVMGMPVVATAKIREEQPSLPQPAYGKVTDQFSDPLPNTLIYLYSLSSKARAPLAAMTNDQGNYGLDLANSLAPAGTFVVEVIHESGERARFEGDIRMINPLPTITIETNE